VLLPINAVDVGQLVTLIQDVIEFRTETTESTSTPTADGSDPTTGDEPTSTSAEWTGPKTGANAVAGQRSRTTLEGPDDATVAVFPSQLSGVEFLKENNAWGFVRINREPEYVAMYISDDVQAVQYVAEAKEIVPAPDAELARTLESYGGDQADFGQDKSVVMFEPESLYELTDPIPYESRVPYSLRYTELGRFRTAETTDDIL